MNQSKKDKKVIYDILENYVAGKINDSDFCDLYYSCYDLELEYHTLTDKESEIFHSLGEVAGRFSNFENDHIKYPGVYVTHEELKKAILEAWHRLRTTG